MLAADKMLGPDELFALNYCLFVKKAKQLGECAIWEHLESTSSICCLQIGEYFRSWKRERKATSGANISKIYLPVNVKGFPLFFALIRIIVLYKWLTILNEEKYDNYKSCIKTI